MLAAGALKATEYTKGYSSFQWCYGILSSPMKTRGNVSASINPTRARAMRLWCELAKKQRTWHGKLAPFMSCFASRTPVSASYTFSPMDLVKAAAQLSLRGNAWSCLTKILFRWGR